MFDKTTEKCVQKLNHFRHVTKMVVEKIVEKYAKIDSNEEQENATI